MRVAFIECKTRRQAQIAAPWAAVIAKTEGGYRAFESFDDYRIWRKQR